MATQEWKQNNEEKMRAYRRTHYYKNRDVYIERVKQRRKETREWINAHKSKLTCVCGEDHIACIVFHHRDPSVKAFTLGTAANRGYSIKRIEAEMSKCDVMCSNCHLKLHFRLNNPDLFADADNAL